MQKVNYREIWLAGKEKDTDKRVAVITDALVAFGGADRLLKTILELYPDAEVYTALFEKEEYPWLEPVKVHTSFLQKFPGAWIRRKLYPALSPLAFEQFRFDEYDVVISLSAGPAKGVITTDAVKHIGIVLTPPRNQWGGRLGDPSIKRRKLSVNAFTDAYLRIWDQEAALRPDVMVAISKEVQTRIKKIYDRDAEVIYPGIDLDFWTLPPKKVVKENHYIVVSRLFGHKWIEVAVDVCRIMGRKLVVVGEGPEMKRLKRRAGEKTEFRGFVDDETVRNYLWSAKAFLFPGIEDFGLAPVEAMACGIPVIAYDKGGVSETVEHGSSGILYDGGSVDDLKDAMLEADSVSWDPEKISKSVQKFSEKSFKNNVKKIIDEATA